MPRRTPASSRAEEAREVTEITEMCSANSSKAAPGRTAGRPRSRSTNRSGRASRRPDPGRPGCGCNARSGLVQLVRCSVLPIALPVAVFLGLPLGLTVAISFWERAGLDPARLSSLDLLLAVLRRGRASSVLSGASSSRSRRRRSSLLIAYPIAYFLAFKVAAGAHPHRASPLHRSVPGQLHHRAPSPGPTSSAAPASSTPCWSAAASSNGPLDWLLYSDFAVLSG